MCGGGGAAEAAAAESARQLQYQQELQARSEAKEAERQAAIKKGTTDINGLFSQYDDTYYNKIAQDYTNNYAMPQVLNQQKRDQQQARFGLSRAGLLNSSAAAKELGDINLVYGQAATDAASRGEAMAQERRGSVESSRQAALAQLQTANDPSTTVGNVAQSISAYKVSPAAVALTDILTGAASLAHRSYMDNIYSGGGGGGSGNVFSPFFGGGGRQAGGRGTTKTINA